ncbi:ion transporter [uncultured Methanospirillum sp.]|uniref:ion transporter n=1 Tax=uncultured Methanospirillum sp. TaxID=262503 RepID=UPI0029C7DD98|nr:ion transporter [uncultured Methanospirillum sp.]
MMLRERYDQIKSRVHVILDDPTPGDRTAFRVQWFLALVVLLNAVAIVLATVPSIDRQFRFLFGPLMNSCLLIFTIEYLLRIWSCTSSQNIREIIGDRFRYAMHLYLLIDLISILPIFFPILLHRNLTLLRTVRLLSIFKLGRYSRYSQSLAQLKRVLFRKREIFAIMVFILIFVVLFSSTLLYLIEFPVQPEKFSSIPASMWWSAMTITTVGYGDIYPVTTLGKIIAAGFTFLGVLVLALPSAILATGFIEEKNRHPDSDPVQRVARAGLMNHFTSLHDEGKLSDQEYEEYVAMVTCLRPKNE